MDNQCQVCGQTRPCCRQSLFELADNRHPKLVIPVKGEIRETWGLGSVWKTCCGTVYGMYYDEESNKYIAMYLGNDEEAALGRVKFVKKFRHVKKQGARSPGWSTRPVCKKVIFSIKVYLKIYILWSFFFSVPMSSHDHHYKDLKRDDFESDENT